MQDSNVKKWKRLTQQKVKENVEVQGQIGGQL